MPSSVGIQHYCRYLFGRRASNEMNHWIASIQVSCNKLKQESRYMNDRQHDCHMVLKTSEFKRLRNGDKPLRNTQNQAPQYLYGVPNLSAIRQTVSRAWPLRWPPGHAVAKQVVAYLAS